MITYCSKNSCPISRPSFINLSASKKTAWNWVSEHKQVFDTLKQLLLHNKTFAYFDPNIYIEVVNYASPVGMGAVLDQQQPNEMKYSQIERGSIEILLIVEWFSLH